MGEDVGYFGGVFRCTEGLYEKYGAHRALDTPIAQGGIVAAAIGMGVNGLRPVVAVYAVARPTPRAPRVSLPTSVD